MPVRKIKIIIVDDEKIIRENLIDYFEDEGMEAVGYENAEEALKKLGKGEFDYAIVDLRLPGMNGNAFVKKANSIDETLKYVIHTGSSDYLLPKELINIGMKEKDVFFKPILDMNHLLKHIKKNLGVDDAI